MECFVFGVLYFVKPSNIYSRHQILDDVDLFRIFVLSCFRDKGFSRSHAPRGNAYTLPKKTRWCCFSFFQTFVIEENKSQQCQQGN